MPNYTKVQLDPNNAVQLIKDSMIESNNLTIDNHARRTDIDKTGSETPTQYIARVTVGNAPVQPTPITSYLGKAL